MDEKRESIKEEELITQDPEFWNDPKKAELVLKGIKQKKFWVNTYDNLKMSLEDTEVLFDFFKEGEVTEEEVNQQFESMIEKLEELELKNTNNVQRTKRAHRAKKRRKRREQRDRSKLVRK